MNEVTLIFALLFSVVLGIFIGGVLTIASIKSTGLEVRARAAEPKYTDDDGWLICEDAERFEIDEQTFEQIYQELKEKTYGKGAEE